MNEVTHPQDMTEGGDVWGPLHRDTDTLDQALATATAAVSDAATAAKWLTAKGYPLNSPLADLLGGLSTVIDGLIDLREEGRGDPFLGRDMTDD